MGWALWLGQTAPDAPGLQSLFHLIASGGPVMVPLGICSVLGLAFMAERWLRLRAGRLGGGRFAMKLVTAVQEGGAGPGLKVCEDSPTPLARIMATGLRRLQDPVLEREKAVEDAGAREVRRLSTNLRPLVVIAVIAPLLGLLGTVLGIIQAFTNVAYRSGLGRPELLAGGIAQALVTTAAGLIIAIPCQAAYYYFRGRIDRFVGRAEDLYADLADRLRWGGLSRADS